MDRREILDGDVVLVSEPGYLRVWHGRSARDLEEAERVLAGMDAALRDWELDRILFDSRESDTTPEDVGARIWEWLSSHSGVVRVATLLVSASRAQNIDVGGIGNDVRIRAFHTESAAVRWLTLLG